MKEESIKVVVEQLKSDIAEISKNSKGRRNGERFKSTSKLNHLRKILNSIEHINQSVEELIEVQQKKNRQP